MDASIMDGKTLKAGAVGSVQHIKNPINLARLVMEKSPHVMLDCAGAERSRKQMGSNWWTKSIFLRSTDGTLCRR